MPKRRFYITPLLLLLSILMLAMPVIPHHHHGSEVICLKNDLHAGCTEATHHHPGHNPHCCHDKGCVSSQFIQQTVKKEQKASLLLPSLLPTSLAELVRQLYSTAFHKPSPVYQPYIESLHGICITRASGLRAPPCMSV